MKRGKKAAAHRRRWIVGLVALGVMVGCSSKKEERPPERNETSEETVAPPEREVVETPTPSVRMPEPTPTPPPAPVVNAADVVPPDVALSAHEQMEIDAEATGLTSRAIAPSDVMKDAPADPIGDLVSSNGVANP